MRCLQQDTHDLAWLKRGLWVFKTGPIPPLNVSSLFAVEHAQVANYDRLSNFLDDYNYMSEIIFLMVDILPEQICPMGAPQHG